MRLSPLTNGYIVGVAAAAVYNPDEVERAQDAVVAGSPHRAEFDARVAAVVEQANSGFFHFELTTSHGPGDPTLVTFDDGDQIVSLTRDHSDRKLTVVLVLAIDGVEAGRLTHPGAENPQELTVGSAVAFPSYVVPTIDLGGSGSMRALITHAVGPAFRRSRPPNPGLTAKPEVHRRPHAASHSVENNSEPGAPLVTTPIGSRSTKCSAARSPALSHR